MNNSINYSGFTDMFIDSNEDFEPYGFVDLSDNMEKTHNNTQTRKAGFNDRKFTSDD